MKDGAAAGIRTRVSSLLLGNFEAWEAPVIDQDVLPLYRGWELDHGLVEPFILTHSETSRNDRNPKSTLSQ
jgi:hypothetical protein